ncbi:MAG: DUF1499 domain-containing protein [Planctomycetales bacterium]
MPRKLLWIAVVALLVSPVLLRILVRIASPRPGNLGVRDGRLTAPPATPNCVSTQADDSAHAISPLQFDDSPDRAFDRLRDVLAALPRARLITDEPQYLHYEFTTLVCGYIDDVEFLLDPEGRTIHFRSASRLGRSDLGLNRKRMETIRAAFSLAAGQAGE